MGKELQPTHSDIAHILRFQAPQIEINHNWLAQYEKRQDSIFNYYSIENEVRFLKNVKDLPTQDKVYYLEENVKRFLGEFVGKIPYTTIPYALDGNGLNYAGIHVMDSYQNAATGGVREKAEIEGFRKIEEELISDVRDGKKPKTAIWISPPKIADYGFIFILTPQENGKIKEYILRYPEQRGELMRSYRIAEQIDPEYALSIHNTNGFVQSPVFIRPHVPDGTIQSLLGSVGINQRDIDRSLRFEKEVEDRLEAWIKTYAATVLAISETSSSPLNYLQKLQESKTMLLSIYAYAQKIKQEISIDPLQQHQSNDAFSVEHMGYAITHLQHSNVSITESGSCPVVKTNESSLPGDTLTFLSNLNFFESIMKKIPLEKKTIENKFFNCPKCHQPIPSGEGITKCPHCGITKEKYAQEVNGKICD